MKNVIKTAKLNGKAVYQTAKEFSAVQTTLDNKIKGKIPQFRKIDLQMILTSENKNQLQSLISELTKRDYSVSAEERASIEAVLNQKPSISEMFHFIKINVLISKKKKNGDISHLSE